LQQLLERQPGRKAFLLASADCYNQLARLYVRDNRKTSRQFLDTARKIYQGLTRVKDDPIMQVERFVGEVYRATLEEYETAKEYIQEAEEIKRVLQTDLTNDPVQLYALTCMVTERPPRLDIQGRIAAEE
jgi:hypothetical protein